MVKRSKRSKPPNDLEIFFRSVYDSLSRRVLEASTANAPPKEKTSPAARAREADPGDLQRSSGR